MCISRTSINSATSPRLLDETRVYSQYDFDISLFWKMKFGISDMLDSLLCEHYFRYIECVVAVLQSWNRRHALELSENTLSPCTAFRMTTRLILSIDRSSTLEDALDVYFRVLQCLAVLMFMHMAFI